MVNREIAIRTTVIYISDIFMAEIILSLRDAIS